MSPTTSKVKLKNIAYMSDWDFMRVLFSSADYFPGLYRYTLGTLPFPYDNLNHHQLYTAFMHQEHYDKFWTQEEWFARQHNNHKHTMDDLESRNRERGNEALADELSLRAFSRYASHEKYALVALDLEHEVIEIVCGCTYMMMGSLIRFEQEAIYVGYDDLTHEWAIKLEVSFHEACEYIASIMTLDDLIKLFSHSFVIGHLDFSGFPYGKIETTDEILAAWHQFTTPIFATPLDYNVKLPIQYAKLIGVSDVTSIDK